MMDSERDGAEDEVPQPIRSEHETIWQGRIALLVAVAAVGWTAGTLGWQLALVPAVMWVVWLGIVLGLLVRHISIPEFKERNEEGLPQISGTKVVVPKLPWSTRWALANMVAAGMTVMITLVLLGQAQQQSELREKEPKKAASSSGS